MQLKIRSATPDDADWIKAVYKQEKEHLGSFNLYQVWDNYLSGNGRNRFSVIEDFAFCNWGYSPRRNCYVIHDIGVKANHKGSGLGKQIVLAIADLARKKNSYLLLKCNQSNERGNQFYEAIGMKLQTIEYTKKGQPQNVWTLS